MRSYSFRALAVLCAFALLALSPASLSAQQARRFQGGSIDDNAKKLGIGEPQTNVSGLGHNIAPGVYFLPTLTLETGYNSNPDEFFVDYEGSPYGLANATGVFGFLKDNGATTLTLRGTLLQYSDDITDPGRWDAGLALDNAYSIAPNTIASFGAYYLRDEISLVASDNEGAYGQLAYKQPDFETFGRLKIEQIGYLGDVATTPATPVVVLLSQPSQFDVQRAEGVSGFIFGPQQRIGFYSEIGGANLDYYSQNTERFLDRDATEFWAISGFRFNLHPSLVVDTGWRFNVRQTEDKFVEERDSNYFDGRLIWTPSQTVRFVAEIDRQFVEPVSGLALMGDKIHYGAAIAYVMRPGFEIGGALRYDQIDQIGDVFEYDETEISLSLSYQWSEKVAVYGLIGNEHVEELATGLSYDKFNIGAGAKIRF